jgi:hypothetical protein
MMRKYLYLLIIPLLLALLPACKRIIDIQVKPGGTSLLVIEGNLTNVTGVQTVSISKTVPYSDVNVYPPVTGATVTIGSSNNLTYTLKETQPGLYTTSSIKGSANRAYVLKVVTDNKTYNATGTMPIAVGLDSIGMTSLSVGTKTVKTVSVFYHDPPGLGNYYRFLLFANGVQVKQVFTISDEHTDGRIVNTMLYQDDVTLKTGDKVDVEMQCIDKNMYNYWYALSQQGGNGPTTASAPANPTSNIDNGTLGYFSVHTTQKKTIVVL